MKKRVRIEYLEDPEVYKHAVKHAPKTKNGRAIVAEWIRLATKEKKERE